MQLRSRKAKFEKGLGVLRASIAQGQWVPRGKATVLAAISQGMVKGRQLPDRHSYAPEAAVISNPAWDEYNELERSLEFGHDYRGKHTIAAALIKIPEHVQRAWFEVCIGVRELCSVLDRIRPKPVITSVGLSPRVTKTLQEMGLALDLSTVACAMLQVATGVGTRAKIRGCICKRRAVSPS